MAEKLDVPQHITDALLTKFPQFESEIKHIFDNMSHDSEAIVQIVVDQMAKHCGGLALDEIIQIYHDYKVDPPELESLTSRQRKAIMSNNREEIQKEYELTNEYIIKYPQHKKYLNLMKQTLEVFL